MSKFEPTASKKTLANEGLYANSKKDRGGETWRGISRVFEPDWAGWPIIDKIKALNPAAVRAFLVDGNPGPLNKLFVADPKLDSLVIPFYQKRYWDINSLNSVNDQQLADNVCDCGINCGTVTAAKMLQRAVGVADDGKIGPLTLAAVNSRNPETLHNAYNELRRAYYEGIIAKNPSQSVWRKSWMSRLIPYKK